VAVAAAALLALQGVAHARRAPADVMRIVHIRSSVDGHRQPAWFYVPNKARIHKIDEEPVPLLVALHTWGSGYGDSSRKKYMRECRQFGFAMIHPNFRGPNRSPSACASDLAVQDVLDAVEYAKNNARIDPRRIHLVGVSGGGHMALVMAHRAPKLWTAVSAWAAPTDLAAWYRQCKRVDIRYAFNLEDICGGPPGTPATDRQYRKRSPLFHLAAAKGVPIDINAGIHDGHKGSTPICHSLRAFNVLAEANGHTDKMLTKDQIAYMVKHRKVPASLTDTWEPDIRRRTKILFRRRAGPVRLTIFDGGHEIDYYAAVRWLARRRRE
jgi:pimeloyl-ACP methyl ester carboxylesterase